MCGRFTLAKPGEAVAAHFRLETAPVLSARYNIAPTQAVLAVRARSGGGREASGFRWGLIPSWARGAANPTAPLINARAEGLARKPAFREAWRQRRCLIPADGFYEWQPVEGKKQRCCWHIRRRDGELFAFAGLWEPWPPAVALPPGAASGQSCALITTRPNPLVAPVHDRMPVVLPPEVYAKWLDPAAEAAALEPLLQPWQADAWERVRVETPLPPA